MIGQIQIQHICIVSCEDKLSALAQTLNHQTEDALFNVALNIGKVFITVIEAVSAGHHTALPANNFVSNLIAQVRNEGMDKGTLTQTSIVTEENKEKDGGVSNNKTPPRKHGWLPGIFVF